MTKKLSEILINVGTSANDKKGDSLRAAFQKVNNGFTDLYSALGLTDGTSLNLGAFDFTGSVISTTDSSAITIDQATTVSSNLTVGGDILPETNLGGSLGSPSKQWKSLYVSTNTIYINNVPLSLDGSGNILVDGNVYGGSGGNADTGDIGFSSGTLYNSASYDQAIWIAPGGESTSYVQVPGNAESEYTQLTINNSSATGGVRIVANNNDFSFDPNGRFRQRTSLTYTTNGSYTRTTPTVIWSGSFDYVSSAKLVIQIEGEEVGDATNLHSQACEAIIASRGYGNGIYGYGDPEIAVYGVVHTSVNTLVTFTVQRDATTRLIEVLATSTAAADGSTVYYSISSVEMLTND